MQETGIAFFDSLIEYKDWVVGSGLTIVVAFIVRKAKLFIDDASDRRRVLKWIERGGWGPIYLGALEGVERAFSRLLGESLFSARSMQLCLAIAFGYTLATIPAASISFNMNNQGMTYLFMVCLVASAAVAFAANRILSNFSFLSIDLGISAPMRLRVIASIIRGFSLLVLTLLIGILNIYFFYANSNFVGNFAEYIGAGLDAMVSQAKNAVSHAARLEPIDPQEFVDESKLLWTILFFLPLLNAFFDFVSLAITRYLIVLLRVDVSKGRFWAGIKHIVLDGIFAVICSFFLAFSIVVALDSASASGAIWRIEYATEYPFSAYAMPMTILILSTFVPTLVHLFLAVLSVVIVPPFFSGYIRASLKSTEISFLQSSFLVLWVLGAFAFSSVMMILVLWTAGLVIENQQIYGLPYYWAINLAFWR